MKQSYRDMIQAIDTTRCRSVLDYYKVLKAIFTTEELVNEILKVSYSTFYQFNRSINKNHANVFDGVMYRRIYRLYYASQNNLLPCTNWLVDHDE